MLRGEIMSAEARIRFSAPFREELLLFLDYAENVYAGCSDYDFVFGTLFAVNGRRASGELAEIFGCEMYDASTWNITQFIDEDEMKAAKLYSLFHSDVSQEIEALKELLKTPSARVFFDPNI
jgi:hypothetical protein